MNNDNLGKYLNLPEKVQRIPEKLLLPEDMLINSYISGTKVNLFNNMSGRPDDDDSDGGAATAALNLNRDFDPDDDGSNDDGPPKPDNMDWNVSEEAWIFMGDYLIALGMNPDRVRVIMDSVLKSKGDRRWAMEKVLKRYFLEGSITEEEMDELIELMYKRGLIGRDAYEALKAHAGYLKARKRQEMGLPAKEEEQEQAQEQLCGLKRKFEMSM